MKKNLMAASIASMLAALPPFAHGQAQPSAPATTLAPVVVTGTGASLTVPDTAQAAADIRRIAGGAELVSDKAFKNGAADTLKDVLAFVPGVFTSEPRYGDDIRVSIRGSALSRPYGNRGVNMFMDGVPINTSDGLVDLFEIDPTAYRYVEVFKGANALRYGGNSLGGAINFVTPTGRDTAAVDVRLDVGSFGYARAQASTGGADGNLDGFLSFSAQRFDGYREHTQGHQERASGNVGWRLSSDVETRFYVNASSIRDAMAGELDKATALTNPRSANADFVWKDQQRNIDAVRLANKTSVRLGAGTQLDFGFFGVYRHVDHPNYMYLDYTVRDRGGFVRFSDERLLGGLQNRLIIGAYIHDGTIDSKTYAYANTYPFGAYPADAVPGATSGAVKGALMGSTLDRPQNRAIYVDDTLSLRPDLALSLGAQFQHALRPREDRLNASRTGSLSFDNFTPKLGLLWDLDRSMQVFANVSRSAEAPTYDVNSNVTSTTALKAQTATTYEIGTRGRRGDFSWDVSVYRAGIRNELQCVSTYPGSCVTVNADRTVHQGLEAGAGAEFLRSVLTPGSRVAFNGTYTYNDFRFRDDATYGNKRLAGVPTQLLRAELLYKAAGGFYAGPNVEWMPQSYAVDNANTTKVDPYALLNLRIGFESPSSRWSGYVEGRNLSDRRYISTVDVAGSASDAAQIFYPGTGRSIRAGLRMTF